MGNFRLGLFVMVLAFIMPGLACAETPRPTPTAAEQRLDQILAADREESGQHASLFFFMVGRPQADPALSAYYHSFFTEALLDAWHRAEARSVKQQCNGRYLSGEICGLDYDPLSCSQEMPDSYVYRTQMQTATSAMIEAGASQAASPAATYHLIKSGPLWKIDGVDCGDVRFHWRS